MRRPPELPDGASLNFHSQETQGQFRESHVEGEVSSCRTWFFTRGKTGECLEVLGRYVEITKRVRGRDYGRQPQNLTWQVVQQTMLKWLDEEFSTEGPENDVVSLHVDRLAIMRDSLAWAVSVMQDTQTRDRKILAYFLSQNLPRMIGTQRERLAALGVLLAEPLTGRHRSRSKPRQLTLFDEKLMSN